MKVLKLTCFLLLISYQDASSQSSIPLVDLVNEEIKNGIRDSTFLGVPLLIVQGIPIFHDSHEEALADLRKEDLIEMQGMSWKKASEAFYHTSNGVLVIVLKKRAGKKWFRNWKKRK